MMNDMTIMMNEYYVIVINQCRCLPKAELNTKTNPIDHVAVWVVLLFNPLFGRQTLIIIYATYLIQRCTECSEGSERFTDFTTCFTL